MNWASLVYVVPLLILTLLLLRVLFKLTGSDD